MFSSELLVHHALLVRKHVLRASKDDDLDVGLLGAKNTRIQGNLHIDVVNARVVRAARRVEALRVLGIAPRVDEIRVIVIRVLLQRLDLAEKETGAGNDTRRVVKLDLDFANGIQELARRLVNRPREVKVIAIGASLGADHPDVLLDAVVELQTNIRTNTRRALVRATGSVLSLAVDDLDLIVELRELLIREESALRILELRVVALEDAANITIGERRQRDLTRSNLLFEFLIRVAVRANLDLRIRRIDNRIEARGIRDLVRDAVELQRSDGQCEVGAARVRKRNGHVKLARTLRKLALILEGIKLANQVVDLLASGRAQDIPRIHKRIRKLVANRAANRERDRAEQALANCILPAGRVLAREDLAVLERDNAGQIDLGVRLPRHVTLARKRKLGRATKTRLARCRVNLDGLNRKGRMAIMDKAPEGRLGLGRIIRRQILVSMALVANLRKDCIVSRATHFEFLLFAPKVHVSNSTRPKFSNGKRNKLTKWTRIGSYVGVMLTIWMTISNR